MAHFVIGTAGHVDHGKTTLIHALTGIDTDRLPEEKERGLSIDIGFAYLTLDNGTLVDIVDVPGHERFLHNMLAGVGGIDIAMLVIDAVEGVKPQTVEHLEILQMLNISNGVVVMTKSDLVDDEWLMETEKEIREFLKGTFLKDASIIAFSAINGNGKDRLLKELSSLLQTIPARDTRSAYRLPVDRVFIKPGFGTVVTGTLRHGKIRVGDRVEILPKGIKTRIRQLQVHGKSVEELEAGQRSGITLTGVEASSISRGDVLAPPDSMVPTQIIDASFLVLPGMHHKIKNRSRIRFYIDTSEIIGMIILLDRNELGPGEEGLIQLRLDDPVASLRGDRFILRNFSALYTLGGGVVIEPLASTHRRMDENVLSNLKAVEKSEDNMLIIALTRDGGCPKSLQEISSKLQQGENETLAGLQKLLESKEVFLIPTSRTYILESEISVRQDKLQEEFQKWHKAHPLRFGRKREDVLATFPLNERKLAEEIISRLLKECLLQDKRGALSIAGFEPNLSPEQQKIKADFLRELKNGRFTPPSCDEIIDRLKADPKSFKIIEEHLVELGEITRITPVFYLLTTDCEEMKSTLKKLAGTPGGINPASVRDALNTSRKYVIPFLEYLDSIKFTRRAGDKRELL